MFFRERIKSKTGPLVPEGATVEVTTRVAARPTKAEPRKVDPMQAMKNEIHRRIVEGINARPVGSDEDMRARVREGVEEVLSDRDQILGKSERERLHEEIYNEMMGLGPLEPLVQDDSVTEIMVNNPRQVYVERRGRIELSDVQFADDKHLLRIIEKIVSQVGRRIDESSPMCDARLMDGSRVNAIIPPLAIDGPCLTIRKFSKKPLTVEKLIEFKAITPQMADFLDAAVKSKLNILIAGGTGSGKTTILNCLSADIPIHERLITIEDAAELQLQQDHVIRLETRPSNMEGVGAVDQAGLLKNCLRMRPDRIILGEVRGGEALSMLQAMNTGHEGSMATLHANTPRDTLARLETMVLMAGMDLPVRAIREQIASALDLVVQIERAADGSRRCTHITEVTGMEGDVIQMQDLFVFQRQGVDPEGKILGEHLPTGIRPNCYERLALAGHPIDLDVFFARTAG
ncbi:MAG: CpaF family protein [Candidatus Sericytochromatia bacterium]